MSYLKRTSLPSQSLGGDRVVTLNLGLGRDSLTMLCLLLEGTLVAEQLPVQRTDITAVVFADTGCEWESTYRLLARVRELTRQAGLRLLVLEKPAQQGEHGWQAWLDSAPHRLDRKARPSWTHTTSSTIEERATSGHYHLRPPILADYRSRSTVVSLGKGDCTVNHKILPIRRLIEDLATEQFDVESNAAWGVLVRQGLRRPHLTLIGYAADEQARYNAAHNTPWYISEAYPLVELGLTKAAEEPILTRWLLNDTQKSGCYLCPYQPVSWYWALSVVDPVAFEAVVQYEAHSLERNPRMTVLGRRSTLLPAVLRWRQENPDATPEEVLAKTYERCQHHHADQRMAVRLQTCTDDETLLIEVQTRVLLRLLGRLQ